MHRDADALAERRRSPLLTRLVDAQALRGTASVVLTGGGVGIAVARGRSPHAGPHAVDWRQVDVWWGDERFVPADDAERNEQAGPRGAARRARPRPGAGAPDGPRTAARTATTSTRPPRATPPSCRPPRRSDAAVPAFDVLLLGVGRGGPHGVDLPGVARRARRAAGLRRARLPEAAADAGLAGLPALCAAREVWLVVAGEDKAGAVALALSGAGRVQVPAAGVSGRRRRCGCSTRRPPSALPRELRRR